MAEETTETTETTAAETLLKSKTFTYDDLRELRRESQAHRLKAKDVEAKLTELQAAHEASKAESAEALKTAVSAAEKAAQERIIRAELKAEAIKAGMVDLDGLKLLDLSTVKLTESGDVEGAEALMKAAKEAKPYLFGDKTSTTSPANAPSPKTPETKLAKDMTPAEYAAAKKALIAKR